MTHREKQSNSGSKRSCKINIWGDLFSRRHAKYSVRGCEICEVALARSVKFARGGVYSQCGVWSKPDLHSLSANGAMLTVVLFGKNTALS
jgi:hypothetical protein